MDEREKCAFGRYKHVRRDTIDAVQLIRRRDLARLEIYCPASEMCDLLRLGEELLAVSQRVLRLSALRDVFDGAFEAAVLPPSIANSTGTFANDNRGAIPSLPG